MPKKVSDIGKVSAGTILANSISKPPIKDIGKAIRAEEKNELISLLFDKLLPDWKGVRMVFYFRDGKGRLKIEIESWDIYKVIARSVEKALKKKKMKGKLSTH